MATIQPGLSGPYLKPQMARPPDSDSDSDSDSPAVRSFQPDVSNPACPQVIHSGHFMVSSPHSDALARRRHHPSEAKAPDCPSIDPTLTRLFECMSLAYSGKLVSPKWKNFKGLRLLCRDKIRLNNAIWRAWYIQYVERRKSPVCGFVTPLHGSEADEHRKPEAVVLEGNYWKRRIEVVMKEYHKWRIYYKKRFHRSSREGETPNPKSDASAWKSPGNWCEQLFSNVVPMLLRDKEEKSKGRQMFDLDSFLSDISDTLFTMTPASCPPQPAPEEVYVGNADMIQPDLAPLQPNLDDFMDISDFFSSPRQLASQPPVSYQDQPCFAPLLDPLFGTSSAPGTPSLLPAPADALLPCGPPSSPVVPTAAHIQLTGGCSSQLSSSSAFLTPGLPPTPSPASPPSTLCPDQKPKPLPPCPFPSKWLSPDPYCSALGSRATLLGREPGCPSPPMPHAKLHYPPSPLFSRSPSPSLSTPCFPPNMPGYGLDPPPAYGPAFSTPCLPPNPAYGPPRGQTPQHGGHRSKAKGASGKTKRPPRLPGLVQGPNPCLAQLLTTAKPEHSVDAGSAPGPALGPTVPESLQNAFSEEPASFLPRVGHPSPHLSPVSSPLQSVAAVAPVGPLLVPKTEPLSPTPFCAAGRRTPGRGSPGYAEGLISSSHSSGGRSRAEPSKMESRRITHISAEQKRRFNIKLGFDTLHGLVSTLSTQPSLKVSKATTLQKTAEYICKLQQERSALQDEAQHLREQIEVLNAAINLCQQQLPATGVPITRQRFDQMRGMFEDYVRSCTLQNWKFWVFSIIMRPLFESFNGMVSTTSMESLSQTSLAWLDQYCSLPVLRPTVLSSLRQLSVSTSILTNPAEIVEQATKAVMGARASNGSC